MTAQFIEIAGERMAILRATDYERLLETAEDSNDADAAEMAEQRRHAGEDYLPQSFVDRLMDGERPLKLWREHRGMTLRQLGKETGLSDSFLSELEHGKKAGKPKQWLALAHALRVSLDDLILD